MAQTVAELLSGSRCINSCIPDGMKPAVLIYLLAQMAGVDPTDTNALIRNARCIDSCIPEGAMASVITKLLCDLNNAGSGCADLSGDGDPTGVTTPEFSGQLYHDTTNDTYYRSTGTTSADWISLACENQEGAGDPT